MQAINLAERERNLLAQRDELVRKTNLDLAFIAGQLALIQELKAEAEAQPDPPPAA